MRSIPMALLAVALLSPSAFAGSDAKAIADANESFEKAFNAGDGAGVAALYTADATILPPGSPRVDGREAIAEFWTGAIASGLGNVELETVELHVSGDYATDIGNIAGTVPDGEGGTTPIAGKYIVFWKNDGGTWRLHRDIWNMDQ